MPSLPLTDVFADLHDPRRDTRDKVDDLTDILVLATCAVIGSAESWEGIAEYGRTKEPFFRRFLRLEDGIPSPDTFERVFAKLDPTAFAAAFGNWMAAACEAAGLTAIAIDGKSAGSARRGGPRPPAACTWSRPGPSSTGGTSRTPLADSMSTCRWTNLATTADSRATSRLRAAS